MIERALVCRRKVFWLGADWVTRRRHCGLYFFPTRTSNIIFQLRKNKSFLTNEFSQRQKETGRHICATISKSNSSTSKETAASRFSPQLPLFIPFSFHRRTERPASLSLGPVWCMQTVMNLCRAAGKSHVARVLFFAGQKISLCPLFIIKLGWDAYPPLFSKSYCSLLIKMHSPCIIYGWRPLFHACCFCKYTRLECFLPDTHACWIDPE